MSGELRKLGYLSIYPTLMAPAEQYGLHGAVFSLFAATIIFFALERTPSLKSILIGAQLGSCALIIRETSEELFLFLIITSLFFALAAIFLPIEKVNESDSVV